MKRKVKKGYHYWSVCWMCGPMVICGYCGNNCCNGGHGDKCIDGCTSAYAMQDKNDIPLKVVDRWEKEKNREALV